MSRPPRARESVLDAFERLLMDDGERAATMDATARAAGVSKGGLLYHFSSKDALEAGLLSRVEDLVTADLEAMRSAPEGPVAFFLRTSVMDDDLLDRALIATSRLAQGGHQEASETLRRVRSRWEDALRPHVRDDAALDLVLLVSDGLYYNNALTGTSLVGPVPRGPALEALIALVEHAAHP
ncbi:TetR/AcrR family transcriptional regulator [Microbacterium dextranolyticum]|uniref:TetR family transcriptional regulator n=1 Tax=Microbacterium dextranolyticum TaxID=36806 RepID=A0A9W6M6R5_9MICO|nr:TetR/AcrR family transcriptional regulator [Microbacterium dextranolyticum]MBM7463145.1 AcrR family transcriptional regulator [Microbacterium dextranolyticum]GLJ95748.1 TetR family transcriptional regulator [Microbacterium dextranolyticum]